MHQKADGEWRAARPDSPTTSARRRVDHACRGRGRGRRPRARWRGPGRGPHHDDGPHDNHDARHRAVDHDHDHHDDDDHHHDPDHNDARTDDHLASHDDDDGARHVEGADQPRRRGQRAEPRPGARDPVGVRRPVGHRAQAARRARDREGHPRQPSVRPGCAAPPDRDGQEPARRGAQPRHRGRRRDAPDRGAYAPHQARARASRRHRVPRRAPPRSRSARSTPPVPPIWPGPRPTRSPTPTCSTPASSNSRR